MTSKERDVIRAFLAEAHHEDMAINPATYRRLLDLVDEKRQRTQRMIQYNRM